MEIYTGYYEGPVGILQIQCTNQFVTSIIFTESKKITPQKNVLLDRTFKELDEYFNGKRKIFEIPFNQQGTEFQYMIWKLLSDIPYGHTINYLTLSKRYGNSKAIRAVASANGKNNLAIVVPCHRVIGSDQSLTGYAGGLWRKKWLLNHEAKYESGLVEFDFN